MTNISNVEKYTNRMRKSLIDKIWFLSYIDTRVKGIYDYGCADGSLLEMIHDLLPDMKIYGYNFNSEMLELAKKRVPTGTFMDKPLYDLNNLVTNVSSVFHEIHNYSSNPQLDYENIFNRNAPYVAIRDMFYSNAACHATNPALLASIYQHESLEKIREFEFFHGHISDNKNFLHYLLKYRYIENWTREVREDYFPHSLEQFLRKIPTHYQIIHIEHYTLPFLREQIMKDFGFTITDPTHAKILLKKIKKTY